MSLFVTSIFLCVVGIAAWAGAYVRWTRHLPACDPWRGVPCVPGMFLVLTAIVLFAFSWHWLVGTFVIAGMGYGGYRYILGPG